MKLYQINEADLQVLEELLPQLCERLQSAEYTPGKSQNELRAKIRRIQEIVMNVRWHYGPGTIEEVIKCDPDPDE